MTFQLSCLKLGNSPNFTALFPFFLFVQNSYFVDWHDQVTGTKQPNYDPLLLPRLLNKQWKKYGSHKVWFQTAIQDESKSDWNSTKKQVRVDPLHFLADQRLHKFAQVILMEVLKSESVPRSSPWPSVI